MKINSRNIPKLRFPGFSGEWQARKLSDIARFSKGSGISKDDLVAQGKTKAILYGELYTTYNETVRDVISSTNLPTNSLVLSKANDVIIPASGETHIDIATASCVLEDDIALSGDINIVRSNNDGVFLAYYLNNAKKINIARLAQGVSVVHLYSVNLKQLALNLPELGEQRKIAEFLTAVDDRIGLGERKLELLKKYKQGVMQKIFTQQIRFKDKKGRAFPDWDERKLGEVMTESRIKGTRGDLARKITVKLWGKGVYQKSEVITGSANTQYYVRHAGQFIYSKLDFLNCAFGIVPKNLDGFESTVDLPAFDIRAGYSGKYLLERIKQKDFYKNLGETADGSRKAKRIHADIFLGFAIETPSYDEQQKIADFLTALDDKIKFEESKLEQAKSFKKSLLQQMFV